MVFVLLLSCLKCLAGSLDPNKGIFGTDQREQDILDKNAHSWFNLLMVMGYVSIFS